MFWGIYTHKKVNRGLTSIGLFENKRYWIFDEGKVSVPKS